MGRFDVWEAWLVYGLPEAGPLEGSSESRKLEEMDPGDIPRAAPSAAVAVAAHPCKRYTSN